MPEGRSRKNPGHTRALGENQYSTFQVHWNDYDTNHGPLTYEMIRGATLQTDWTAMNTSNEALIEQKEGGTRYVLI